MAQSLSQPAGLYFQFPKLAKVHCFFPLRDLAQIKEDDPLSGGNLSFAVHNDAKNVQAVRAKILNFFGPKGLQDIFEAKQVHGQTLFKLKTARKDQEDQELPCADGLCTELNGCGLLIKTADCQCLLFTNEEEKAVMAIHVGWRGNRAKFIKSAVQEFCTSFDCKPSDLSVVRGPSLSPACAEFRHFEDEWPAEFRPFFNPQSQTMDLWALTKAQLSSAGLSPAKIYSLDLCTYSNQNCFSYRRAKNCGRLGGLIWLTTN